MVRVTNAVASRKRKKRIRKAAKGYWGDRKNHLRITKTALIKSMAYSYEHRRRKKRDFRRLWITRLSVATKMNGISYSRFINGLSKAGCLLDRKMLSEMAIKDPQGFSSVVDVAKAAVAA